MTTQEKIEAIRQECIRHNKEITELKFGCEFDWTNEKMEQVRYIVTSCYGSVDLLDEHDSLSIYAFQKDDIHSQIVCFDSPDDYEEGQTFFTFAKIIGRKITLPDVLLAMKKSKKVASRQVVSEGWIGSVSLELFADDNEELAEISINEAYQGKWNLLKPLEEQEEPTISFIYELVK